MATTHLDRLSVDLLHNIWSYLSGGHILKAFYSTSNDLNNALINYDEYRLDLSTWDISKSEFDLICSFLRPEQIVGLKFSECNFDLLDRFILSIPNEQQLNRLRSLWIDDTIVVNELLISRLASIISYENLKSIRFDRIRFDNVSRLTKYKFKSLTRLVTSSSEEFRNLLQVIPTHLTFLHMHFDSINNMNRFIRPNIRKLKSLGVGIECDSHSINRFLSLFKNYRWTQLIQFNLNISGDVNLEFDMLQEILTPMYNLKYMTLIFNKRLRFSIEPTSEHDIYDILNTFKSQWWSKKQRWFVEYDTNQTALITVPYFASKTFNNRQSYSFDLMQNPKIFYSNINNLSIDLEKYNDFEQILMSQPVNHPRFNHVTRLSLNGYLTTDICDVIRYHVNLSMIQHFEFLSNFGTNEAFTELLENMTNLSSIHLQCLHSLDLFNLIIFPNYSLRDLVLFDYEPTTKKQLYSRMSKLFPRLTHFTTDYHSRRNLRYLLKKFVHLERLALRLPQDQYAPNQSWITQYTRLRKDSFELRVFNFANAERWLVLWINTNKNMEGKWRSFKNMFHTITDIKLLSLRN